MVREAREEAGIDVLESDLTLVHVSHRNASDGRAGVFFRCTRWTGTLQNAEPHKCDALTWFAYDHLPDNTIPYVRRALQLRGPASPIRRKVGDRT
jgi:8-oxo-dGTP pyrophosphatase MutT (NUDIX family)